MGYMFTIFIVTMYELHVYNFYSYHAWVTGLQSLYRGYMVLICTTQVNLLVTCISHVTICISQQCGVNCMLQFTFTICIVHTMCCNLYSTNYN